MASNAAARTWLSWSLLAAWRAGMADLAAAPSPPNSRAALNRLTACESFSRFFSAVTIAPVSAALFAGLEETLIGGVMPLVQKQMTSLEFVLPHLAEFENAIRMASSRLESDPQPEPPRSLTTKASQPS